MRRVKNMPGPGDTGGHSCGCGGGNGVKAHIKLAPEQSQSQGMPRVKNSWKAYNRIARGVKTLNATVELKPTAGSKYSGVIDEYHEVKAFVLAARPAEIRRDRISLKQRLPHEYSSMTTLYFDPLSALAPRWR